MFILTHIISFFVISSRISSAAVVVKAITQASGKIARSLSSFS